MEAALPVKKKRAPLISFIAGILPLLFFPVIFFLVISIKTTRNMQLDLIISYTIVAFTVILYTVGPFIAVVAGINALRGWKHLRRSEKGFSIAGLLLGALILLPMMGACLLSVLSR